MYQRRNARFSLSLGLVPLLLGILSSCGVTTSETGGQTVFTVTQQFAQLVLQGTDAKQTATCPTGTVLISGGFSAITPISLGMAQYLIRDSYPSDNQGNPVTSGQAADSWTVRVKSSSALNASLLVSANCLKGHNAQTIEQTQDMNLNPGDPDTVTIQPENLACTDPNHHTLTGGGFMVSPGSPDVNLANVVVASAPFATNGTLNQGWSVGALSGIVREFVVCAGGIASRPLVEVSFPAKTNPQNQLDGSASCPAPTVLAGGGYFVTYTQVAQQTYMPIISNASGDPDLNNWHVGGTYTQSFDFSTGIQSTAVVLRVLCVADTP